jgi:two-component system response regulator HydG
MSDRGSGAKKLRRLFGTRSREFARTLENVEKVLDHDVNVLIVGESGTGKNYLAEAIHACGARSGAPFVSIECASLPPEIFESELFGHERGAFTDAQVRKIGKIELAQRGTIFFDEIGTLPSPLQAKLLRVIQERRFSRLGSNQMLDLNVRVISSSNLDLDSALASGAFRKDLYYRLNVLTVALPPLRHRREDIPNLARRFLRAAARRIKRPARDFEPSAMEILLAHSWPGNVRELSNVAERAAVLSDSERVTPAALPSDRFLTPHDFTSTAASDQWTLEELEKNYIREVLRRTRNNFSRAAELLGINRKTLLEKRRRYRF